MITANIINRVFRIRWGDSLGTAFTIDIDNKQYLITAKHVVNGLIDKSRISIFGNNDWDRYDVDLVGHCESDIDISVLALSKQLTPSNLAIESNSSGITYGQDAYFLGFPYDILGNVIFTENGFPLPFVKRATVSCFDSNFFYLDGHNNPGFSGGPVVFTENNLNKLKISSVISGYQAFHEPILRNGKPTSLSYLDNTGIIISYSIRYAIDIIRANPIGIEME